MKNIKGYEIITLSADNQISLNHHMQNLLTCLKHNQNVNMRDVAYALNMTQKNSIYREAIVCNNSSDAVSEIINKGSRSHFGKKHNTLNIPCAVFMFPGLGNQYEEMGMYLYQDDHEFKKNFDFCVKYIKKNSSID